MSNEHEAQADSHLADLRGTFPGGRTADGRPYLLLPASEERREFPPNLPAHETVVGWQDIPFIGNPLLLVIQESRAQGQQPITTAVKCIMLLNGWIDTFPLQLAEEGKVGGQQMTWQQVIASAKEAASNPVYRDAMRRLRDLHAFTWQDATPEERCELFNYPPIE